MAFILAVVLLSAAGAAGVTAKRKHAPALLPVSDTDTVTVRTSGCESWFTIGETGYLFAQGSDFLLRVSPGRLGLKACHLPQPLADRFERGGPIACGGRTLTLRQLGRATEHSEADSADYPAALSINDGLRVRTLRGRFGTAC